MTHKVYCFIIFLTVFTIQNHVRRYSGWGYQYPLAKGIDAMASISKNIKSALFLFTLIFVLINPGICAEQIFYSIQFATSRNLKDVNAQVNSLKAKGRTVFWEKTDIAGMGQLFRVYVGRYNNWDDAVAFRDRLKKAGAEGPLGIQWFSEAVEPKDEHEPPKLIVSKKLAFVKPLYSTSAKNRFVDNKDGTITDTATNLMWIKNGWRLEFISALPWFEALDKVRSFKYRNYTDWRLPTIEEWNSLIDTNKQNPALVEPNPFENIISHMPYWSKTEFTYDKNHICDENCTFDSYIVLLWSGTTYHQKKSNRAFILPVRSITTQ